MNDKVCYPSFGGGITTDTPKIAGDEPLMAVLAAHREKREAIGEVILLIWDMPAEGLTHRELVRAIRKRFGFSLQYCPVCQRWLPVSSMTKAMNLKGVQDRPRRCKKCDREVKQEWSRKNRSTPERLARRRELDRLNRLRDKPKAV